MEPSSHPSIKSSSIRPSAPEPKPAPRDSLSGLWDSLIEGADLSATQGRILIRQMLDHYSAPGRSAYNLTRLSEMAEYLSEVRSNLVQQHEALFALYYYNIERDPLECSYRARRDLVRLGADAELLEGCTRILLDARGKGGADCCNEARYLINADRIVLSSDPSRYAEYAKSLRSENAMLKDPQYFDARLKMLAKLSGDSEIFFFEPFDSERNVMARRNIARELRMLGDAHLGAGFNWEALRSAS